MVTVRVPDRTIAQLLARDRRISEVPGWCLRATNSSVSWRDLLSLKRNGTITQPRRSGTRHPHCSIFSGGRMEFRTTPTEAATMTAICLLPYCQLTQKPLCPGVATSETYT